MNERTNRRGEGEPSEIETSFMSLRKKMWHWFVPARRDETPVENRRDLSEGRRACPARHPVRAELASAADVPIHRVLVKYRER